MKIKKDLLPTYENVTKEFISNTLHELMCAKDDAQYANFLIDFKEDEAIDFIKSTYNKSLKWYSLSTIVFMEKFLDDVLAGIEKAQNNDTDYPVMEISNYKLFFENLRKVYEKEIDLYYKRKQDFLLFSSYDRENLFTEIWLRCTPEDFKHPEEFLERNAQMMSDNTFEEYDEQQRIGKISIFDNNILNVKNGVARTWDEAPREMIFRIFSRNSRGHLGLFEFPVIRYGIIEQNNEKVCLIGSIQNKASEDYSTPNIKEIVDQTRKVVNRGVPGEEKKEIEPKKIIALSMFINLLHQKGITKIQVPSMYVLDYPYHEKRVQYAIDYFNKRWPENKQKENPEQYLQEKEVIEKLNGREDFISKTKTENFVRLFSRILHHYPNGSITNYPGEVSNTMQIEIPVVKNKQEIKGEALQKLYEDMKYREKENIYEYER